MSGVEHSPLPWRLTQFSAVKDANGEVVAANGFASVMNAGKWQVEANETAALIVRSVNALPALVKALEPVAAFADAYFHKYETRPGEFRRAHQDAPDDQPVYGINHVSLTVGHLRAVLAALAAASKEAGQ